MRPRNKSYLRPRCENCRRRIYRTYSPYRRYETRKIPSHCPRCGEPISDYQKKHLIGYEAFVFLIGSTLLIVIVIIIYITLNQYQ